MHGEARRDERIETWDAKIVKAAKSRNCRKSKRTISD